VVLTVLSDEARAEADALAGAGTAVTYLPTDTPAAVRRFLDAAAPTQALCLGPGLWPTLSRALQRRAVPATWLITAYYPAAWRWARRLPPLFRGTLARPAQVLLGQEADHDALVALGIAAEQLQVTGNPLLDSPAAPEPAQGRRLRAALQGRPILVFDHTEPGEEELLAGVCRQLPAPFTHWLMVLQPAQPERVGELAERFARFELATAVASRGDPLTPETAVYLLDDAEQRPAFLAAADAVVLGGTWIHGFAGADPLPAAAAGRGLIYGPYAHRHREVLRLLDQAGGALQAPNVNNLLAALRRWLQQPGEAQSAGRQALATVRPHRGATQRAIAALTDLSGD
jgi:3-deoxy-D-manno-octulosonic-acid transferase